MSALSAGGVRLKPSPPSLDYHCARCNKPITKWEARIDPVTTKLILTARCHGDSAEFTVYLGMGGTLFEKPSIISWND